MGFNSAFKGLRYKYIRLIRKHLLTDMTVLVSRIVIICSRFLVTDWETFRVKCRPDP